MARLPVAHHGVAELLRPEIPPDRSLAGGRPARDVPRRIPAPAIVKLVITAGRMAAYAPTVRAAIAIAASTAVAPRLRAPRRLGAMHAISDRPAATLTSTTRAGVDAGQGATGNA